MMENLHECINEVWTKGKIPEGWKEDDVKPVYKRGDEEKAKNYRGITLMITDYKIYVEILRNRLVR